MTAPGLSHVQLSALAEAARGRLVHTAEGWGRGGWHSAGTVRSLTRRGLLALRPGGAVITPAGLAWLGALGGQNLSGRNQEQPR